jgi:hypothetical protein
MPFAMLRNLRRSPLATQRWDGVVWYAPTIFLGPMANALKKASACRSYLIVRDIFPEWAVDMGLMGRGLPYRVFKAVERYQYSVADVIGVQAPGNLPYLGDWAQQSHRRAEVLQNWLAEAPDVGCSVQVANGPLAGRTHFCLRRQYGGCPGHGHFAGPGRRLRSRTDVGFVCGARQRCAALASRGCRAWPG